MPHYDRSAGKFESANRESVFDDDEQDPMDGAAQALREAEVEAVRPAKTSPKHPQLETLSLDELRAFAAKLDVPDAGAATDQAQLIAKIRNLL